MFFFSILEHLELNFFIYYHSCNFNYPTFFHYELPHPGTLHFHAPNYYIYAIPLSLITGLIFLVYFGLMFGEDSRIRQRAYDKIQELMAKK